jgi:WAS/WASL-interacting protein
MRSIIYLTVALSFACLVQGFGQNLIHSAGSQESLPTTTSAASAAGWVQSDDSCIPSLGQGWNKKHSYPTESYPITLYFAANGQISGFGTEIFGTVPDLWNIRGYYTTIGQEQYRIKVATRSAQSNLCSISTPFSDTIGDRIIINPDGINQRIPANEDEATAKQWTSGACIDGMGRHWEYDLVTAPYISYNASNLLPVVPMYDNSGNLNAIFFASKSVQQGIFGHNQWDVIPINGYLMCKNFCGDCGWSSLSLWSTMHMWFGTTSITCSSAC